MGQSRQGFHGLRVRAGAQGGNRRLGPDGGIGVGQQWL